MANRMNPPAERQEKDVLLVLDKQQGKVSAVKGIDNEGNLQTVEPTQSHSSEFMQVDRNSDVFSNFISNFSAGIRTRKGWLCSAARLRKRNRTQKLSRTTTATPRRRATDGRKCCEFRIPTITEASRTTVSTRLKSTGRT